MVFGGGQPPPPPNLPLRPWGGVWGLLDRLRTFVCVFVSMARGGVRKGGPRGRSQVVEALTRDAGLSARRWRNPNGCVTERLGLALLT